MADRVPLLPYNYFQCDPPLLPVRQHDDTGGPDVVIQAVIKEMGEYGVTLQGTTSGGVQVSINISLVSDGVARVRLQGEESCEQEVHLARPLSTPIGPVTLERSELTLCLRSPELEVEIELEPFHIAFYDGNGRVLLSQNASERTNVRMLLTLLPFGFSSVKGKCVAFHDSFTAEPDEHFYGFGEKFTDFDKRGQRIQCWNYDCGGVWSERSYKNVPFFISTRGYGIFVDSTRAVDFDMAASNTASFSLINPGPELDYYVIAGPDPSTIIERYSALVSLPILPPKWSLGLWMSSGFQRDSADAVLERARQIRAQNIPCDILHLDCYWQRFGRWSELLWDAEMFPDPAALLVQIKEMGFKVCLWINPYIGVESERFAEASEKGYFLKSSGGETYVVDSWGGFHPPVGIVDMTNPVAVAWFQDLLRESLRMGVDVFKTDFGEGIPLDAIAYNGLNGAELHNLYPLLYNDAVASVTEEETGHSGLVWARATYAGGQRHAAQWGGDANCTFPALASTLRGGLSMAMCGHSFWSHDIGGFTGHPTPELYIRWAQFGFLSPLTRAHGNTTRLPWDFGEEALRIFRQYATLRYRLLPYIYSYACIAEKTSLPLLRPMILEFPADPSTYTLDLQYMFGKEILVAPIFNTSGERTVYLPEGRWIDFWTCEVLEGSRTLYVRPPLDTLPLYIRANALIPTIEPPQFLTEDAFTAITFDAYLLDKGSFDLHDSDGTTRVTTRLSGNMLVLEVEGVKNKLSLRLLPLPILPPIEAIAVNRGEISERRMLEDGSLLISWICQS